MNDPRTTDDQWVIAAWSAAEVRLFGPPSPQRTAERHVAIVRDWLGGDGITVEAVRIGTAAELDAEIGVLADLYDLDLGDDDGSVAGA